MTFRWKHPCYLWYFRWLSKNAFSLASTEEFLNFNSSPEQLGKILMVRSLLLTITLRHRRWYNKAERNIFPHSINGLGFFPTKKPPVLCHGSEGSVFTKYPHRSILLGRVAVSMNSFQWNGNTFKAYLRFCSNKKLTSMADVFSDYSYSIEPPHLKPNRIHQNRVRSSWNPVQPFDTLKNMLIQWNLVEPIKTKWSPVHPNKTRQKPKKSRKSDSMSNECLNLI